MARESKFDKSVVSAARQSVLALIQKLVATPEGYDEGKLGMLQSISSRLKDAPSTIRDLIRKIPKEGKAGKPSGFLVEAEKLEAQAAKLAADAAYLRQLAGWLDVTFPAPVVAAATVEGVTVEEDEGDDSTLEAFEAAQAERAQAS